MFKLFNILLIALLVQSCQRNVEIIESGFRFDPRRYQKTLPGVDAINGEVQKFSKIIDGSGNELSPDDLATFEVHWSILDQSVTEYLTIGPSGEIINRNCDEDKAPNKSCPPEFNRENQSSPHPLNTVLRHAFNGRASGTSVQLEFGKKQFPAWNRKSSNNKVQTIYTKLNTKLLESELLTVNAKLISACYPKWKRVTTTTYSIPAMKNTRVTEEFMGCGEPTMPKQKDCFLIFCTYSE